MPRLRLLLLLGLLPASLAWAANTQFSTDKPVINFRLPAFTPEGHRDWLARGSEARYLSDSLIKIKELTLSVFSGKADGKIDTIIISPLAELRPANPLENSVVTGPSSIRVINDQFEASGSEWRYERKNKKISIGKNVRVTFNAEFTDLLK